MSDAKETFQIEPFQVALGELVTVFEEEAQKMCYTDGEARILAAEALSDFLNTYSKNFLIG